MEVSNNPYEYQSLSSFVLKKPLVDILNDSKFDIINFEYGSVYQKFTLKNPHEIEFYQFTEDNKEADWKKTISVFDLDFENGLYVPDCCLQDESFDDKIRYSFTAFHPKTFEEHFVIEGVKMDSNFESGVGIIQPIARLKEKSEISKCFRPIVLKVFDGSISIFYNYAEKINRAIGEKNGREIHHLKDTSNQKDVLYLDGDLHTLISIVENHNEEKLLERFSKSLNSKGIILPLEMVWELSEVKNKHSAIEKINIIKNSLNDNLGRIHIQFLIDAFKDVVPFINIK